MHFSNKCSKLEILILHLSFRLWFINPLNSWKKIVYSSTSIAIWYCKNIVVLQLSKLGLAREEMSEPSLESISSLSLASLSDCSPEGNEGAVDEQSLFSSS